MASPPTRQDIEKSILHIVEQQLEEQQLSAQLRLAAEASSDAGLDNNQINAG